MRRTLREPELSDVVQDVLRQSNIEAAGVGSSFVHPEHVVLGILRDGRGAAAAVLARLGLTLRDARDAVRARIGCDVIVTGTLPLHPFTRRALRRAGRAVVSRGSAVVGDDGLLLAMLETPRRPVCQLLTGLGVRPENIRILLDPQPRPDPAERPAADPLIYARPTPRRRWWWPWE